MQEFVVYVLYSENYDRLYIGYTSDLITRFNFHNVLSNKGFTIKYRPWKVIHVEFYLTKSEAMQRELALKSGKGRLWIRTEVLQNMKSAGFISA
ncbi:MAG: GIY-YIG nuclease family protein [Bacteriovoracia bacterium]